MRREAPALSHLCKSAPHGCIISSLQVYGLYQSITFAVLVSLCSLEVCVMGGLKSRPLPGFYGNSRVNPPEVGIVLTWVTFVAIA